MQLGQNTIYSLRDNPLRRDVDFLGERCRNFVKNISFIGKDKILVDMRTDRGLHARYFALFNTRGDLLEMPATLQEALVPGRTWFAVKYRVLESGNFLNVLANKQDVAVIETNPKGQVLNYQKIDELEEKETASKGFSVKINARGDVYIIKQVDKDIAFRKLDKRIDGRLIV